MRIDKKMIKYSVNKVERTVSATYLLNFRECLTETENVIRKAFSCQPVVKGDAILRKGDYPVRLIEVNARCHPDDEFDVKKGMDICYYRILLMCYEEYHRILKALITTFYDAVMRMENTASSLEGAYIKVSALINDGSYDTVFAQFDDLPDEVVVKAVQSDYRGNSIRNALISDRNLKRCANQILEKNKFRGGDND